MIYGPGSIGDNTFIGPNVAIGTPAEMPGSPLGAGWIDGNNSTFMIGSNTVIREFVTVQVAEGVITSIGNGCYIMTKAHVPHHAMISDNATIASAAVIGGHGRIGEGAYLGLSSVMHQRLAVGSRAMVGMGSVVTKHVPPFAMAYGIPARIAGANVVGMQRAGYADELGVIVHDYYKQGADVAEIFADERLASLKPSYEAWLEGIEGAAE
ncbi:MAG: UDP-N-acetylglucosamine acyltransferase [Actinomycetia bacterium]|nr:UDP-N-acetylglucosamine acyltransferase [Actinomycetes bacterium]